EILYPAMEDFELDIVIGQGPGARSVKVPIERFTLVGATTRTGLLTSPLRARFGIVQRLDFYNGGDLGHLGGRSGGTPRCPNRLLRRVRDYAQVRADGRITPEIADAALKMLEVDEYGFDE